VKAEKAEWLIKFSMLDDEQKFAWQVACYIRRANDLYQALAEDAEASDVKQRWALKEAKDCWHTAGLLISCRNNPAKFLLKVSYALEEEKWPMPDDWRTIQAYHAAQSHAGRSNNGFDPFVNPSFEQVRTQFIRLFPKIKLPAEWTIRKQLKRYKLTLRAVPSGRRKGSKDRLKRKPRNDRGKRKPR
jgi:hypothetical protein